MSGLAALTAVGILYSFSLTLVNDVNDAEIATQEYTEENSAETDTIPTDLASINNLGLNSYNKEIIELPDENEMSQVENMIESTEDYEAQPVYNDSVSITPLFENADEEPAATQVPEEFAETEMVTESAAADIPEPEPEVKTEEPEKQTEQETEAPETEVIVSENLLISSDNNKIPDEYEHDDSISFVEIAKKMAEMDRAVSKNHGLSADQTEVSNDFWSETVSSETTTFITSSGTSFETVPTPEVDPNAGGDAVTTTALIYNTLTGQEILTARVDGEVQEFDSYELVCMIVSTEMSPSFSKEALKAQAVAAYSYVKYHNVKGLVPSVLVKHTVPQEVSSAVAEVIGKCVYYNGQPAQTMYTASTAGTSADPKYLWGGAFPYLVSVDTSFDADFDPNWGYVSTYSEAEIKRSLENYLGITLSDDPSNWLKVTSRVNGKYVDGLDVDGQTTISGMKMREKILKYSLKSWAFDVSYADGVFTFVTYGYGHGVGMSQNGANYLGKKGWTYDEILQLYFPGTYIE